jgi:hypothetical protein
MKYLVIDNNGLAFCGIDESQENVAPDPIFKNIEDKDVLEYARKDVAQEIAKHFNCKVVKA